MVWGACSVGRADRKGVTIMMAMMAMMGLKVAMMTPAMMHLSMAPGLMMMFGI